MKYGLLYALILLLFAGVQVYAETEEHHDHDHRPEFSPPLFMEKPVPCSEIRFDYSFADGDETDTHTGTAIFAKPFAENFGFELALPYSHIKTGEGSDSEFGDLHFSLRGAHYKHDSFAFGYGLGVGIPLEDDDHGHSHWHLEPFYSIGYLSESFEAALSVSLEIPVDADHGENEAGYGIYIIKPANHHLHLIAEFQGHTVLNGEEKGESNYDIAGGVRFYPFEDHAFNIGIGVKRSLSESDYEAMVSFMIHL